MGQRTSLWARGLSYGNRAVDSLISLLVNFSCELGLWLILLLVNFSDNYDFLWAR